MESRSFSSGEVLFLIGKQLGKSGCRVQEFGSRVPGLELRLEASGLRTLGFSSGLRTLGFRSRSLRTTVEAWGAWVSDTAFRLYLRIWKLAKVGKFIKSIK